MGCSQRRGCPRVGAASKFFFFFLQIRAEPGQFGQNQVVSTESDVSADGQNRPKSALNHVGTAEIGFK